MQKYKDNRQIPNKIYKNPEFISKSYVFFGKIPMTLKQFKT